VLLAGALRRSCHRRHADCPLFRRGIGQVVARRASVPRHRLGWSAIDDRLTAAPEPSVQSQPVKLGQPWTREIVPGVFRVGTTFVGCYVIEDAGAYTFVDAGLPGYWRQMTAFLASRSAPLSAVKAVVLTHHHPDHMGNAERLRTQAGAKVLVHHDDLAAATRKGKAKPPRFPLWKPQVLHLVVHMLRNGVAGAVPVAEASSFADEEVLDVPGRPRVIHTPGHTAGNAALSLEDRGALFVGDTLATMALGPGESGPHLPPRFMNDDHELALASLRKIELVKARWVLPAHGLPWEGRPQQAVELARQIAAQAS
jgi:glyoxylase-like metal-dependent hydrolase (beta-lactamase superfamily II)